MANEALVAVIMGASLAWMKKSPIEWQLVYVFADPHTQTSRPVPPANTGSALCLTCHNK